MSLNKPSNAQMILPLALDDKASFANFYSGDNHELVEALQSMVLTKRDKVVYFYGGLSSGKTHLMYAALRLAKKSQLKSHYFSLVDKRVTPQLMEMTDTNALICVDDVEAWANDDSKERALFALFERVKNSGGILFVSAKQPPQQCEFDLHDLVSRLGSGLVYALHALNDAQCFEAIKLRTEQRGMSISDETVKYLLSRSSRDARELFSLLDKIDRASLVEKRRITIPFLQSVMG